MIAVSYMLQQVSETGAGQAANVPSRPNWLLVVVCLDVDVSP
jgi:hypothetical protein